MVKARLLGSLRLFNHQPRNERELKRWRKDLGAKDGGRSFPETRVQLRGKRDDDALAMPAAMTANLDRREVGNQPEVRDEVGASALKRRPSDDAARRTPPMAVSVTGTDDQTTGRSSDGFCTGGFFE